MGDYGIKVSRASKEVTSSDLRDLLMHSNYAMFKYHLETTSTMTISAGDTSKTITIPHGLPYVPAFMVYSGDGTYNTMLPNRRSFFTGEDEHIFATADSTNIYIKWKSATPHLIETYTADGIGNFWNTFFNSDTSCWVGKNGGDSTSGALRFTSINLNKNQTITSAYIDYMVGLKGDNSNYLRLKTYGIDEDNTSNFNDPMGRDKTSAYTTQTTICPPEGERFGINVKSQIEEITSRAGWSNGNAMAFIIYDDGSDSDVNAYDAYTGDNSRLVVQKTGSTTYSFRVLVFKDKIA